MDNHVLEKKIASNNKEISELLRNNEGLIREAGFEPPKENFCIKQENKIKFPAGYIRTTKYFNGQYHLDDVIENESVRKNLSYALQISDFYDFIIKRFYIWGSVETLLYKYAFVNIISVIEALIVECVNRLNSSCISCDKTRNCDKKINKNERNNMKSALKKLRELNILELSDNEQNEILDLYDLRNKIHIRLSEQNEFLDDQFNEEIYNKSIKLLREIDVQIWENGVEKYNTCLLDYEN